jgi:hypothetical protein
VSTTAMAGDSSRGRLILLLSGSILAIALGYWGYHFLLFQRTLFNLLDR